MLADKKSTLSIDFESRSTAKKKKRQGIHCPVIADIWY